MRTAIVCAGTAMNWGAALLPKFMDHLAPTERSAGFGPIRTAYTMLGAGGSVVTGPAADLSRWAILGLTALQGGMLLVLLYSVAHSGRSHSDPVPFLSTPTQAQCCVTFSVSG